MLQEQRQKIERKQGRIKRIRRRIIGTPALPRLSVTKTNRNLFAQLIDDSTSRTLASSSTLGATGKKTEAAAQAGQKLAKQAVAKKITKAVFDRRGAKFHGRVKSFADAATKAGLKL